MLTIALSLFLGHCVRLGAEVHGPPPETLELEWQYRVRSTRYCGRGLNMLHQQLTSMAASAEFSLPAEAHTRSLPGAAFG